MARSTRSPIPARALAWLDAYEGIVPGSEEAGEYTRLERPVRLASGQEITAWVYLYQRTWRASRSSPTGAGRPTRRLARAALHSRAPLGTIR